MPDMQLIKTDDKKMNGWGRPANAAKWHYFNGEIYSLCRRWLFAGETEQGMDEHADNCKACMKKKSALDAK
jgi:hypothetical protein